MSIQTTITQLRELGLHGMAEAFESMMRLPLQKRPELERAVEKMIQTELCIRDRKLAEKLLKAAKLRYKVFIEDITCSVERNLTEGRLAEVADCNFIRRGENLLITLGLSTLFLSMNHFADELTKARLEGTYQKLIRKLGKKDLLILDDFGLQPLTPEARLALLTLLEDRYEEKSVIITSQLPLDRWYDYIAEPTLADAIMDRLINSSEHIELKGETLRHNRRRK